MRGPIPTRRRATAKTSVQSPLWKKNTYTSLAPVLFLLFPSFSKSLTRPVVVRLFLLVFVLALPLFPSLPYLSTIPRYFPRQSPRYRPFFSVQRLLPSLLLFFWIFFLSDFSCHFASVYPLVERRTMQRDPDAGKKEDGECTRVDERTKRGAGDGD